MTATFKYGGTSLTSFGVVTLLDDYLDMPQRRGENQTIPYRHGTSFVQKFFDQRNISIGITVFAASQTALEAAMDTMRGLFAPRTEQTLELTTTAGAVRNISASVDNPIQFARVSDRIARVVVDFTCCSPFFRLSTVIADNTTTINSNPKAMVVTNTGTVEERDPVITLTGPLQNIVITNSTNGAVLTYTGTIASPRVVTISTSASGEYIATTDLGVNVIGNITHSGSAALMTFNVGANTLSIASDIVTTGTVKCSFYPPFL